MASEPPTGAYIPGTFDTERRSAAGLPLALIEQWRDTGQSHEDARRLLGRYATRGYSVVSDSAGLTKLSQRLGLLEVLALIDRPKRILHARARAIGGEAVGVWAADNAQMFHPESADAGVLLSALLKVQDEIERSCRVRIGIGAHFGSFYGLAGGLYGPEADAIEDIAENHTEGGELAVTGAVVDRLPPGHSFVLRRKDGPESLVGAVYHVLDGPRPDDARPVEDLRYPIPYSAAFYADLLRLERCPEDVELAGRLAAEHLRDRTVVLVERSVAAAETPELGLLRGLALSAVLRETGLVFMPARGAVEIKIAGPLALYLFEEAAPAVRFARRLRAGLAEHEIVCRIGVAAGLVLAGETPGGGWDVAGAPVNLASKMAQDLGRPGRVYLSEAVHERLGEAVHERLGEAECESAQLDGFASVRRTVSGVEMTFFEG
ncbi:adenylate/guanylate cyclase domain-containing protein [Nonomuraea sp. NPDC050680]|uniref:adenylate/guanylate cyclase domain-containing protein n=1 Tax=Nonomuraea sp. NPDC050680 TaxID=3154630 RepID=UPI0033D1BFE2